MHDAWKKALDRRTSDPEGAITAAKTLLETVCKHIIDEVGKTYGDNDDLPKLYHIAAECLNLAPTQHTEPVFKSIEVLKHNPHSIQPANSPTLSEVTTARSAQPPVH